MNLKFNPQITHYINRLIDKGIYGNSPEEIVQRLVCDSLNKMMKKGEMQREIFTADWLNRNKRKQT